MNWATSLAIMLGTFLSLGTVAAQTATTGAASAVTDMTATISGTVNPGFFQTGSSGVEYGTTTSYGSIAYSSPPNFAPARTNTQVMVVLTQLAPSTTYHYRVVCYGTGFIAYGQDMTFTTQPPSTSPTIGSPSFFAISYSSAGIQCPVHAGNSDATVRFEYGTTTSYGHEVFWQGTVPRGTLGSPYLMINGLSPSTTYHVRCVATNSQGTNTSVDAHLPPTPRQS